MKSNLTIKIRILKLMLNTVYGLPKQPRKAKLESEQRIKDMTNDITSWEIPASKSVPKNIYSFELPEPLRYCINCPMMRQWDIDVGNCHHPKFTVDPKILQPKVKLYEYNEEKEDYEKVPKPDFCPFTNRINTTQQE